MTSTEQKVYVLWNGWGTNYTYHANNNGQPLCGQQLHHWKARWFEVTGLVTCKRCLKKQQELGK